MQAMQSRIILVENNEHTRKALFTLLEHAQEVTNPASLTALDQLAKEDLMGEKNLETGLEPSNLTAILLSAHSYAGKTLKQVKQMLISEALEACNHNTSKAAKMLGLSTRTVQYQRARWRNESI